MTDEHARTVQRSDLELGPIRDFERDMVLDLWGEEFGYYDYEGYETDMVDKALDRDHAGLRCYTIGHPDELAAFMIVNRLSIEDFDDAYPGADTSDWPKATWNAEIYMVAVADRWKRQHFATYLHQRAAKGYLLPNDYRRCYAVCWDRLEPGSPELFESLGYRHITTIPNYYETEDGEPDRDCPVCGVGCGCSAKIYTTVLEDDDAE